VIILKGNVRHLRPTLFDLLAHRALDYFKNEERNITRPAYAFEIDDPKALAPASEFIKASFITKDSLSLHHKALLIYKELLAFHIADNNKDALIDADIARLEFVHQYGVMTGKTEQFIAALDRLYQQYKSNPASAMAGFIKARTMYQQALQSTDKEDTSSEYSVKKAKQLLDAIIKDHPKSEGGIHAQNLATTILHPELNVTVEKVNVPGLPFRALVNYKNFSRVHFRIIPFTDDLKKFADQNTDNQKLFSRFIKE